MAWLPGRINSDITMSWDVAVVSSRSSSLHRPVCLRGIDATALDPEVSCVSLVIGQLGVTACSRLPSLADWLRS